MGKYARVTSRHLAEIRRRNAAGENDAAIARAIGFSLHAVRYHRVAMGLPRTGNNKKQRAYTVWDAQTDELLAYGSAAECAKALGFAGTGNFYTMVSRVKHGQQKKYAVLTEVI